MCRSFCISDVFSFRTRCLLVALLALASPIRTTAAEGDFAFADPVDYPVNGDPYALAVADFDGKDGVDVVTSTESATLRFLMNNGNGTLRLGQAVSVPSWALNIAVGDFDGSNGPDVATADFRAQSVSIVKNDGTGSFGAPESYPVGELPSLVDGIVVADFDGRNGPDLAVNQSSFDLAAANGVSVLINKGNGTFAPGVFYPNNLLGAHAIATADLDGINGPDLVLANRDARSVSIYLNRGDGTLALSSSFASAGAPIDVAIAELDGASGPDLVLMKFFDTVELRFNKGDGTFGRGLSYVVNRGRGPAVGDFDLDGDLDLVGSGLEAGTATLMPNEGAGRLGSFVSIFVGHGTEAVVAADLDGQGGLDLVFSDNDAAVDAVTVVLNEITARPVDIDLQPWSNQNRIDPSSTRLVPVAVLGSADFDALQCDLSSIRLAPGDARSRNYRVYDVNRDGFVDMLTYFRSREIPIPCGESTVELTGTTHQGMDFRGSDKVTNSRCR